MAAGGKALFLHGGPGSSAWVERQWFGAALPIRWWDQPPVAGEASPFEALVEAAGTEVCKMAEQGPVHLLAHSFGGQLAHALARRHPALVGRVTLLACPSDPARAIVRLCQRLAAADGLPALLAALAAAEADLNPQTFAALAGLGASAPGYPGVYFPPGAMSVRDRYLALQRLGPPLDFASFLAVMNGFLHRPLPEPVADFAGFVDVVVGRHDPVASPEADGAAWRRAFPQARLRVVEAGHFLHLEVPAGGWFDGVSAPAEAEA